MPDSKSLKTVRAFIAVPLDPALVLEILDLQKRLRLPGRSVRWTRPEHIHLTLKFLGDVAVESLAELQGAVRCACAGVPTFRLAVAQAGCFPDFRKPKIIWAGITGDLEALHALQRRIEKETLRWSAHPEDREFHPHLTIGRTRQARPRAWRALGKAIEALHIGQLGEWTVRHVEFMKSELTEAGPIHTPLERVALD
jgi:2'-5' RNA ligase